MANDITSFRGKYEWLSNFWEAPFVTPKGTRCRTVEHAFQAAKTLNEHEQLLVLGANTPKRAKYLGRQVTLRKGWDKMKDDIMHALVRMKFEQNPDLAAKLLATGDARLVEGNRHHDNYWGVCSCGRCRASRPGRNKLGIILMAVRNELRK